MGLCTLFIGKIEKRNKVKKDTSKAEEGSSTDRHQISILSTSPSQFQGAGNFLEDSISMLERTSLKIYPIVKEVLKRMIEESSPNGNSTQ